MAAILLDVDGVLHVSGEPIAGGANAVRRLRDEGHRLRFVTNSTTRSRAALAEQLRSMGIELDDEELETTARAAARALAGKRVLALTMHAIVGDLEGVELVGEDAEAVLVGGADETAETNVVFSFMNLARAFQEDEAGAQRHGMKTVLVRTGKFRPDAVERTNIRPDAIVSSIAQLPDWLEEQA